LVVMTKSLFSNNDTLFAITTPIPSAMPPQPPPAHRKPRRRDLLLR
jgi:hypothetical protein